LRLQSTFHLPSVLGRGRPSRGKLIEEKGKQVIELGARLRDTDERLSQVASERPEVVAGGYCSSSL